jgi:hypothetical protein
VRTLDAQAQQAPGEGAEELQLALAPGLRAARSQDEVMLQAQVRDAGGQWHSVTSAEARDGLPHLSDLGALQAAHGQPLPAATALVHHFLDNQRLAGAATRATSTSTSITTTGPRATTAAWPSPRAR